MYLALLLCSAAAALASENQVSVHQQYRSSGSIRMHLEAGDYNITGIDADDVVVSYRANSLEAAQRVKVKFELRGSDLEFTVANTPNNNFHADIDVPKKSGIWIRLTAGDINIAGVEGDKDVSAHAGDIAIQIPHPDEYGKVEGSALAGDIEAHPFGLSKSGIFRSFDWHGKGQYHLRVHVTAGDITLRESN
jgi:DUF4097 and DUF4098 domain-containing protein YvlB